MEATQSSISAVMRPRFMLTLSKPLVELLMKLSSIHYDWRCKAASKVGGFLYGWRNHFVKFELTSPVETTSHEMDTLMKIMEMPPDLPVVDYGALAALRTQITTELRAAGVWA